LNVAARGQNGTTAASHFTGAMVYTVVWPSAYGGDIFISPVPEPGLVPGETIDSAWHYTAHVMAGDSWATVTTTGGGIGLPDYRFDHFAIVPQRVNRSGCWTQQVLSRTSNTIQFNGASWSTNQWAGRFICLLAHANAFRDIEVAALPVASNTSDTLTIGVGPDGTTCDIMTAGIGGVPLLDVGDLMTMTMQPTAVSSNSFNDSNLVNSFQNSGLDDSELVGKFACVLFGTGAGQFKQIAANSAGGGPITLTSNWDVLPDSTSVIVIVDPLQFDAFRTQGIQNPNKTTFNGEIARPDILNLGEGTWLIKVYAEDGSNNRAPEAPVRLIAVFGAQGTRIVTQDDTMHATDGIVFIQSQFKTQPPSTTLASDIDDVTTSITLTDGSNTGFSWNTDLQIGDERMRVVSGMGTTDIVVERGSNLTTPVTHAAGDTVLIAAIVYFKCLPAVQVANQKLICYNDNTVNNNAVDIQTGGDPPNQDAYPDGSNDWILPDNSGTEGTMQVVFPVP
jgi:hypothetical protein